MRRLLSVALALTGAVPVAGACPGGHMADTCPTQLVDGLSDLHHEITTSSAEAQAYFDQGLKLAYAFNHAAAERSFAKAAELDPTCAMCYWGMAYVLGPTINTPMPATAVADAYSFVQKAEELAPNTTPAERAYIDAIAKRYASTYSPDRSSLDKSYADAMRELVAKYPDDVDALTIFTEALMDLSPWDYWLPGNQPKPTTTEAENALEHALELQPLHIGANHFYVHLNEAAYPEKALVSADRLQVLAPAAGHLVHMSAHIYIRVGRYHDAALANERAIEIDNAFAAQCPGNDVYHAGYMLHNFQFLIAATEMEGRSARTLEAARELRSRVRMDMLMGDNSGMEQDFWAAPLFAEARFGKWDEILAEAAPMADLKYATGAWHYARAIALMRLGRVDEAKTEVAALRTIADDTSLKSMTRGTNNLYDVLQTTAAVAEGELLVAEGDYHAGIVKLEAAVQLNDKLRYDEPAAFYIPPRQVLGAVLIGNGRASDAAAVYREDLERNPENGWSLFGLYQSLKLLNRTDEAAAVKARFDKAFERADVLISSSRF